MQKTDPDAHHSEGVTKSAGLLVGQATKGTNTAQGGCQVGHLVTLRVPAGSSGSIASKEDSSWEAVQVGVLWGVSGPVGTKGHFRKEQGSSCLCVCHLGKWNSSTEM